MHPSYSYQRVEAAVGPYGTARLLSYHAESTAVVYPRASPERKAGRPAHYRRTARREALPTEDLGGGKLLVDGTHEIAERTGTCRFVRAALKGDRMNEAVPLVEFRCERCNREGAITLKAWQWRERKHTATCTRCRRQDAARELFGRGTLADKRAGGQAA